jgi:hypothetical protein
MMRKRIASASVWLLVALMSACAGGRPLSADLCALEGNHIKGNGEIVRIRAVYLTDLREYGSIGDPKCPKFRLKPVWPDKLDGGLRKFNDALTDEATGLPEEAAFTVDVSGRFVWTPGPVPHGVLYLSDVHDFRRIK